MNGRWVVAFLVGVALVIAFGVTLLPRAGPREIMRHQIETLLGEILPGPVAWKRIEIFLEPPAIRVTDLVAGSPEGDGGAWRAKSAWLDVAPQPLHRGLVEVLNVRLSQVVIDAVRGRSQAAKPAEASGAPKPSEASGAPTPPREAPLLAFGLDVEEATLRFKDLRVDPPLRLVFPEAAFQLVPGPEGSRLTGLARMVSGGQIDARGHLEASGGFELELRIEHLPWSILSPYVDFLRGASGDLSGEISLRGSQAGVTGAEASLRVEGVHLELESMVIDGPVGLRVTLASPPGGRAKGELLLDAREAFLVIEEGYRKEPGKPARLRADFEVDSRGALKMGDFDLSIGKGETERS